MINAGQRDRDRRAATHHHLMRVVAPHFVAGLVLDDSGKCIESAPILAASIGKSEAQLRSYFERRGWQVEVTT